MQTQIDFNCDLGEGMGNDAAILPFISSASLACGFHAGDACSLNAAIHACIQHGVAIGAHPSYADREHFGRVERDLPPASIRALVTYQIGATAALVRAAGGRLAHVKPHGALYNRAAVDAACAEAIVAAICDVDRSLILYGLSGSELTDAGERAGLHVVFEVFAERRYQANGRLVPRTQPGAVIERLEDSIRQVQQLLAGHVTTIEGHEIGLRADSLCLHGDRIDAADFGRALHAALTNAGVRIVAPGLTPRPMP